MKKRTNEINKNTLLLSFLFFLAINTFGQTTLFTENFESCGTGYVTTGGLCNWKQINGGGSWSNWVIYSSCHIISGSRTLGLYDDNWSSSCDYDWDNSNNKIAYFYTSKVNATGYNTLKLNFKWRCGGEASYDYGKIVYSYDGVTWFDVVATQYQGQTSTQTVTNLAMPGALDNQQFYIGFRWINDGSAGSAPGFTVDDIEITGISSCGTPAGTSSASPNSFCPSGNTTLTLAGEDGAATIQWQVSTNGGSTWSNIAGATTDPWVQPVAVNSMYRALVTNGCTATSTTTSVTVGCPDIIQPTSGTSSTTIQCGGSYNYYDSGGSGSNYTNNQNGMITICPSVTGQYVSINFASIDIENNYDYMYIFDGNDGFAQLLGVYTGALTGTITASAANTSGCISLRFTSDGASTDVGWNATVTCTGTPGGPYAASGIEDCTGGVVVCSDGSTSGGATGYGLQELPGTWNSCLNFGNDGETQSNWYHFSPATSGTIGFLMTPNVGSGTDYDWTIWGPYNSLQCPAFTNDSYLRCSGASFANSGPNGETGLKAPATDVFEDQFGNGYLKPLTVIAGEIYVMMLDNWDGNGNTFNLTWQLSNGATLDCTPTLPVTLLNFEAQCDANHTALEWACETEINNNFFIVEKSGPDFVFKEIGKVFGAGNSNITTHYSFIDQEANEETAYYRLLQVDYDGSLEYHRIVASNCHDYSFDVIKTNLSNNNLGLLITSGTNENLIIRLYNSTGKLITQQSKEINAGNNSISLRNFNISSGIYLISIQGEYNNYSEKILSK